MVYYYYYECLVGGVVASTMVLAFVVLKFAEKNHKSCGSVEFRSSNGYYKEPSQTQNHQNGFSFSSPQLEANNDNNTEIIIVGAGVAGSALAYTLAKVPSTYLQPCSSFLSFFAVLIYIYISHFMSHICIYY